MSVNPIYGRVEIRRRERRQSSPTAGLRQEWIEWQVVQCRRVLSRHDTEAQARRWVRENTPSEWHDEVKHAI